MRVYQRQLGCWCIAKWTKGNDELEGRKGWVKGSRWGRTKGEKSIYRCKGKLTKVGEVEHADLRSARAEEASRTNSPKDDRFSGKNCGLGAYEGMFLSWCANVLDVVKHPILNKSNPDRSNNSRNNLSDEHDPGRDLHVMSKLQTCGKFTGSATCNISNRLEDGICNGPPWKHVTRDEIIYHGCGDLLVRDGQNHRKRDGQDEWYEHGDDSSPDRKLSRNDFNCDAEKGKTNDTNGAIPPRRNFGVVLHESRVNIVFIL